MSAELERREASRDGAPPSKGSDDDHEPSGSNTTRYGPRGAWRKAAARAAVLMTTVPTSMSWSSRRRALKRPTSRINGVIAETVTQNTIAWTAPSREYAGAPYHV